MGVDYASFAGNAEYANQIQNDISVVSIAWFVNRCPFVTRFPRVPAGSSTFTITERKYRPRTTTLNAAANNSTTSFTLVDASPYMVGDVFEINTTGERIEITADPNTTTNVITVNRAVGTVAAASASNGDGVTLIGNSRTGAEVDQTATAYKTSAVTQYCQTFQHAVQVGGSAQATMNFIGSNGATTPFDQNKFDSLQNLMDDMEYTFYLGQGSSGGTTNRPKTKGLKSLIGNVVTSPTNAGAYKPVDLIRDAIEVPRANGGSPDVLLVSTNFMTGFATWGHSVQRLDAGATRFGTPIDLFEAPFVKGLTVIEAPLLPAFTCVSLTSAEVRMRMKRNEFWNPRGNRGDAIEGEWIAEGAPEVDNPSHHAWVQGITTFSAT